MWGRRRRLLGRQYGSSRHCHGVNIQCASWSRFRDSVDTSPFCRPRPSNGEWWSPSSWCALKYFPADVFAVPHADIDAASLGFRLAGKLNIKSFVCNRKAVERPPAVSFDRQIAAAQILIFRVIFPGADLMIAHKKRILLQLFGGLRVALAQFAGGEIDCYCH